MHRVANEFETSLEEAAVRRPGRKAGSKNTNRHRAPKVRHSNHAEGRECRIPPSAGGLSTCNHYRPPASSFSHVRLKLSASCTFCALKEWKYLPVEARKKSSDLPSALSISCLNGTWNPCQPESDLNSTWK